MIKGNCDRLFAFACLLGLSVTFAPEASAASKPTYDKKMQLGQLHYFNGNVDSAIKAFLYAATLKPEAFEPHLNLINLYVQRQELDQAVVECQEVLKRKPNQKDVYLILGNLYRSQAAKASGDEQKRLLEEAVNAVAKARDMGADEALCEQTMGVTKVQKGDHDAALVHLDAALKKKPALADAHLVKALLHFKKGEKEVCVKHLDLAIKHKEKNAEALNTKGDVLFSMGKHDDAMDHYKKAVEADPRYFQGWSGIGNLHIQRKDYEKGLDALQRAKSINPGDKNVLYSLGVCLEKMGQVGPAIEMFEQGIFSDQDPTMKAQIQMHVNQLRSGMLFKVPGIGGTYGVGDFNGINPTAPINKNFFSEDFQKLIKIKAPDGAGPAPTTEPVKEEKPKKEI